VESVFEACQMLAEFPMMGTSRRDLGPTFRSWVLGSHTIFYRVHDDFIYVTRVLHQRRNMERTFGIEQ